MSTSLHKTSIIFSEKMRRAQTLARRNTAQGGTVVPCRPVFPTRRKFSSPPRSEANYTTPCAIIASATFSKPAMFAPTT